MSNFVFNNPNPRQRYRKDGTPMRWNGTDCTIRSLSIVMGWTWIEAYEHLFNESKKISMTFDDIEVLKKVYKNLGFSYNGFGRDVTKPTVDEFCRKHKRGKFILSLTGHVVAVINGKYNDTWDCGNCKVRSFYYKKS